MFESLKARKKKSYNLLKTLKTEILGTHPTLKTFFNHDAEKLGEVFFGKYSIF
jgi:hypothetical protein